MKYDDIEISAGSASRKAVEYGIDLSLLRVNLKKTPERRIRDMTSILNAMRKIRNAMKQHDN